jgi:hypothetical protein
VLPTDLADLAHHHNLLPPLLRLHHEVANQQIIINLDRSKFTVISVLIMK